MKMSIKYDRLWQLMEKNKLKKSQLAEAAEISDYAMGKLKKNEPVSLVIMMRICKVFHCNIEDVVEIVEES